MGKMFSKTCYVVYMYIYKRVPTRMEKQQTRARNQFAKTILPGCPAITATKNSLIETVARCGQDGGAFDLAQRKNT